MPIPLILMALSALGIGGALGTVNRKLQEQQHERDFMQKAILDSAYSGQPVPEALTSKYISKDASQFINTLAATRRLMQEQNRAMFLGAGDAGQSQAQAPDASGGMVPGQTIPPESGPGGLTSAQLSTQADQALASNRTFPFPPAAETFDAQGMPRPALEVPGINATVPGQTPNLALPPLAPAQPAAPAAGPMTAQSGPPSAIGAPVRPTPARTMSGLDLGGGIKGSATQQGISVPEAQKMNEHRTAQQFLRRATASPKPYPEMLKEAGDLGLLQDPNVQKAIDAIGQQQRNQFTQDYWKVTTGGKRPFTPDEQATADWFAWSNSGFGPPPVANQESMDQQYASAFQRQFMINPNRPIAEIDAALRATGLVPTSQAQERAAAGVKTMLRDLIIKANPGIANNPNAIDQIIGRITSGVGQTAAERASATEKAPVDQKIQERRAEQGLPPITTGQLRGQEVDPGTGKPLAETPTQMRQRIESEERTRAAASARETARAAAEGTAAGAEAVRPNKTLSLKERESFVDPKTLQVAPEGTKWKDVGEGGKYVTFTGTPKDLHDATRLRTVVDKYGKALETLKPLLEQGAWANFARTKLVTGSGALIKVGPITIGSIPPGALPDAATLKAAFPGVSDDQAKKYARAMVDVQAQSDTMLSILRTFYNEKGNVRGDLIASGARAFPSLSDNWLTASQKYNNMLDFMQAWERGFGLPGIEVK